MKLYENVVTLRARVKCPSESKKDTFLSDKLCSDTGADTTSLRVRKDLFKLRDATRWRDKARKLLRDKCVPWTATRTDAHGNRKEDALWACSGRDIEEVATELQQYREEFFGAVKQMTDNYDTLLEEAKGRLGSAYNPDDFPTRDEFKERFGWEVEVTPLQDIADMAEDFRTKLPQEMAEEQVKLAEEKLKAQMSNGVQNVMDRAIGKIIGDEDCPGIVPRLKAYDPDESDKRKGNTFRDKSIYENMDDFRDWVGGINDFLDDEALGDLHERIGEFCDNVRPKNPEDIRTSSTARDKVVSGLMEIVDAARPVIPQSKGGSGGFGQFV